MATSMLKDPSFAKATGTDRTMGSEYVKADRKQKAFMAGRVGGQAGINKQNTNHGKMDLPFASLNRMAGKAEGGVIMKGSARTRKFAEGGTPKANEANPVPYKKGGAIMAKAKGKNLPPWLMKKEEGTEGSGKAPPFGKKFAAGGAIKTFAKGGGIEQRGKTRGKMC